MVSDQMLSFGILFMFVENCLSYIK